MRNLILVLILVLCSSLVAYSLAAAEGEPATNEGSSCVDIPPKMLEKINRLVAEHVDAHQRVNAPDAVAVYSPDVWLMWEGGYDQRGRALVEADYAASYETTLIKNIVYHIDEFKLCGDVAWEIGRFDLTSVIEGKTGTVQDRYMAIWMRQVSGDWRLHRILGHRHQPTVK